MKKILYILLISIVVIGSSCTKDEDFTGEKIEVTISGYIFRDDNHRNAYTLDSVRYYFYNNRFETIPFAIKYSGADGKVRITLNKQTDYYFVAVSRSYMNSSDSLYYYQEGYGFTSTKQKTPKELIPNDCIFRFSTAYNGPGSTAIPIMDPAY